METFEKNRKPLPAFLNVFFVFNSFHFLPSCSFRFNHSLKKTPHERQSEQLLSYLAQFFLFIFQQLPFNLRLNSHKIFEFNRQVSLLKICKLIKN